MMSVVTSTDDVGCAGAGYADVVLESGVTVADRRGHRSPEDCPRRKRRAPVCAKVIRLTHHTTLRGP